MRKDKPVLILLTLLLLLGAPIMAQDQAQEDNQVQKQKDLGTYIMGIVVGNEEENEEVKRDHITYDKTVTKYDTGKNPPEVKEYEISQVYGVEGRSIERVIEKNGKAVRSKPKESELDFNAIMAERFDFILEDQVLINGKGYFIIGFKPKEPMEDLPSNNMMDEGINRMAGTLYVDIKKLYTWKLEGHLIAPFKKGWWGSLGALNDFSITIEQEERFGVIVPKYMEVTVDGRIIIVGLHEKRIYTYSNHFDRRSIMGPPVPDPPQ